MFHILIMNDDEWCNNEIKYEQFFLKYFYGMGIDAKFGLISLEWDDEDLKSSELLVLT